VFVIPRMTLEKKKKALFRHVGIALECVCCMHILIMNMRRQRRSTAPFASSINSFFYSA